jgi:hypothetical protein
MSSIIQRLVMRARDPAVRGGARIEPVLTVRYPTSAFSERTQENVSPAPRSPDSRGSVSASALSPTHATVERRAAQTLLAPPVTPAQLKNGESHTEQHQHRAPVQQLDASAIATASSKPITETLKPLPDNSAPTREPVEAKTVLVPADATAVIARPMPESTPSAERKISPIVSPPAPANVPRSRGTPVADIVQTTQEITISIGHIEIRGAPTPAAPKRSEFRPRISLGDFLGREVRR